MTDAEIIAIVRNDPVVGVGTCSMWDECATDAELVSDMRETMRELERELTRENILEFAYRVQNTFRERGNF